MDATTKEAILDFLSKGEVSGRELRQELFQRLGFKTSSPKFYAEMAKLEDERLVFGFWAPKSAVGIFLNERRYRLPAAGDFVALV